MPSYTNTIILERDGDDENAIIGGYTTRHKILSCDVDPAIGTLNYFRLSFPVPAGMEPKAETGPRPPANHSKHVSELDSLIDEEIDELTHEHGITIRYQ